MNNEQKIEDKFGRQSGFNVPEGFLEEVYSKVAEQRGPVPEFRHLRVQPSRWQKLRPYFYLAAMFAGIWCMMKVFSISQKSMNETKSEVTMAQNISLDNPPEMIAEAVNSHEIASELQMIDAINNTAETDIELEDDIKENFANFEDFEQAFDYEFEQQYANINVEEIVSHAEPQEIVAQS